MQKILLSLILIVTLNSYSQISFEKGYIINNSNNKIECLIKNLDWKSTPKTFQYKINESSEILIGDLSNVKEFRVYNQPKYIRNKTKIDKSSTKINEIGYDRNPKFIEEQIFLKVLVDGNVQLFVYADQSSKIYFTGRNFDNIEQLFFKAFFTSTTQTSINYNNLYKTQLEQLFDCNTFDEKQIQNVDYSEKDLTKLIIKYDNCINPSFSNEETNTSVKKDYFNLSIRPRLNSSSLNIENKGLGWTIDFDKKTTFGLGLEAEFVLPYNKNKWAILIEPSYLYYKAEGSTQSSNVSGGQLYGVVDYKTVEVPIGLRHYLFLNKSSKIFINLAYVLDFTLNATVITKRNDDSTFNALNAKNYNTFNFGLGYKYKRYSIEFRGSLNKNILVDYKNFDSKYKNLSVIVGYTLF